MQMKKNRAAQIRRAGAQRDSTAATSTTCCCACALLKAMGGTYETDYAQSTRSASAAGRTADMDAVAARMKEGVRRRVGLRRLRVREGYGGHPPRARRTRRTAARGVPLQVRRQAQRQALPLGSPEICAECGALLLSLLPGLTVDVTDPGSA